MPQATLCSVGEKGSAMNTSSLVWGLLFGSIGIGFIVYGKRQRAVVPLVCGVALIIFPYFVSSAIPLVAIGVALVALPYFVRF
jgi:hypothetical protein